MHTHIWDGTLPVAVSICKMIFQNLPNQFIGSLYTHSTIQYGLFMPSQTKFPYVSLTFFLQYTVVLREFSQGQMRVPGGVS